jgi:hypothetical protein
MNAEEAYKIANGNANIEPVLTQIKVAAANGDYHIVVPRLSEAQQKKLLELGYLVIPEHDFGAISGRTRDNDATKHKVSWHKFGLMGNLNALMQK